MKRRGSLLIMVLLLLGILFALGLGYLSSRVARYRASASSRAAVQAEALAYAGLEDARVKLNRDHSFPPAGAEEQPSFTYTEELTDFDGQPAGYYLVSVDVLYGGSPYYLVRVTSTGAVGPRDRPLARRTFEAEWNRSDRSGPPPVQAGQWMNFRDLGTD